MIKYHICRCKISITGFERRYTQILLFIITTKERTDNNEEAYAW